MSLQRQALLWALFYASAAGYTSVSVYFPFFLRSVHSKRAYRTGPRAKSAKYAVCGIAVQTFLCRSRSRGSSALCGSRLWCRLRCLRYRICIVYLFSTRSRVLRLHSEALLRAIVRTCAALNASHSLDAPCSACSVYADSVSRTSP